MDADEASIPETQKQGIRASAETAPVPSVESSISLVRSDTGSQSGAPATENMGAQISDRAYEGVKQSSQSGEFAEGNNEDVEAKEDSAGDTTQEEAEVIQLLRTPKLSIKYLDNPKKETIRRVMQRLHHERGISLVDIAKLIGNKTSGYTSWLFKQLEIPPRPFEEARLKGIHEKVRKYERKPFDGTPEDKAYLLGVSHGDFHVSKPWKDAIRVSTSTTHPAMVELFRKLFEPSGHIYQHPRYKKDTQTYEWNLQTILDSSFEFLLMDSKLCWAWVSTLESTALAYVAGVLDSEGHIGISPAKDRTALTVNFYNTNIEMLWSVHKLITNLGYNPLEPYLDKAMGFRSPGYHIEMKKDYWRVVLARFEQSQSLLRRLPLKHPEKIAKRQIALSLTLGDLWVDVEARVKTLRTSILLGRDQFVKLAETEYLRKHPNNSSVLSQSSED